VRAEKESDKEVDDDPLWGDGPAEEEDSGALAATMQLASATMMDIESQDGVDVRVPELLDFLSDTPSLMPMISTATVAKKPKATTSSV
jgi:hypothetical protein